MGGEGQGKEEGGEEVGGGKEGGKCGEAREDCRDGGYWDGGIDRTVGNALEYTGRLHPGASLLPLLPSASTGVHSTRALALNGA